MKYVRVKDNSTGHEFSEPEGSPLIGKGLEVVGRKAATTHPLPPKFNALPKKSPAGDAEKKEG